MFSHLCTFVHVKLHEVLDVVLLYSNNSFEFKNVGHLSYTDSINDCINKIYIMEV